MTNSGPIADAELIDGVRRADEDAFSALFERYQPVLFRAVLSMVRHADAAHDVVQETFVRVWEHRGSLRPDQPFLGLLFRISRNLVRDAARYAAIRAKSAPDVDDAMRSAEQRPDHALDGTLLQERLGKILRTKLPPKCREVFLLSRVEGMSNGEIAENLGLSVKTVENQMTKALRILRSELRMYRM